MTDMIDIDEIKSKLRRFAEERDWNKFHTPKNLAMAIAGEVGELIEIFQWMTDEESLHAKNDNVVHQKTSEEIADIFMYLIRLIDVMAIDLKEAINIKMELNSAKYPANLVRGSAKKYDYYISPYADRKKDP